jgi:excisionase family DNA binding protein
MNTIVPNSKDIALAKESSQILAAFLKDKSKSFDLQLNDPNSTKKITIPASASIMLLDILTQMSKGNAVAITPVHAELTTQEAADLLVVSRPFMIKQLEEGKIPFKMVGTRRKILFEDLMKYKEDIYRARQESLDKLIQDAQDNDMGY